MSEHETQTDEPPKPGVTEPVSASIDLVTRMLFNPFAPRMWFVLGFAAFLGNCGRTPMGSGTNFQFPGGGGRPGGTSAEEVFQRVETFLDEWMALIVLGAIVVVLLIVGIRLLTVWLSCRADFVFLHQIAKGADEFAKPWAEFARLGNSLFLLRAGLSLAVFAVVLLGVVLACIALWGDVQAHEIGRSTIVALLLIGLGIALVCLVAAFVGFFVNNVVLQIMYAKRIPVMEAWRDGAGLLKRFPGTFVLYWLMKIALFIGAGFAVTMVSLLTCCLCFVGLVPIGGEYLLTVLTLPVWVALMAYSAYFIEQFGPEYSIMGDPYDTVATGGLAVAPMPPEAAWLPPDRPHTPPGPPDGPPPDAQ